MAFTFHWQKNGKPLYISLYGGTLTLSFDGAANLSFDGEGRLVGAFIDGVTYRRALDNRILAKWLDPERRRRQRRFLNDGERRSLLERCTNLAVEVDTGLQGGRLVPPAVTFPLAAIVDWLAQVAQWDWSRLEAERLRFLSAYKPVPILPPDQYLSIVVQATEGCSYNECSFCTFYRDRRFHIKTGDVLNAHLNAVYEFLGRGQAMRKGIFLADANAVIVPQRLLLPMLDAINTRFVQAHSGGLYAFISAPDANHKSAEDFAALRDRNLRRLYVGLESGHDSLRQFLRKPGSAADVGHAVQTMKAGGVAIGLIIMIGVGGETYRAVHRRDTLALIQQMPLGAGDIVYLSPFVVDPASPYASDASAAGIVPLDDEGIEQEIENFRSLLKPWARACGVRVSTYDIREFVY